MSATCVAARSDPRQVDFDPLDDTLGFGRVGPQEVVTGTDTLVVEVDDADIPAFVDSLSAPWGPVRERAREVNSQTRVQHPFPNDDKVTRLYVQRDVNGEPILVEVDFTGVGVVALEEGDVVIPPSAPLVNMDPTLLPAVVTLSHTEYDQDGLPASPRATPTCGSPTCPGTAGSASPRTA